MQSQSNSYVPLAIAIVIATALVCATLIALNLRTTYPITVIVGKEPQALTQLLSSGCTLMTVPDTGARVGLSCPLWVRP